MKRGTPRHPKVFDLMSALGIKCRPTALGYLELLWHFAAEFAPQGDIGRYSVARIEGAMDWPGKPGRLVEALTTSGWVDVAEATTDGWVGMNGNTKLLVHDWSDHADEAVRKKLSRAGLSFIGVAKKVTGQNPTMSGTVPDPCLPALALARARAKPEPPDAPACDVPAMVGRLRAMHPKAANQVVVERAVANAISRGADPGKLEESHAAWCATDGWRKQNGTFAPKLPQWIEDEGYLKLPNGSGAAETPVEYTTMEKINAEREARRRKYDAQPAV